jgi:hypothetical protein
VVVLRLAQPIWGPVPVPNPSTWADALKDAKAERLAPVLPPIVDFESTLAGKQLAPSIENAAKMPADFAAQAPGIGAEVLGQLLSVVVAKAKKALAN